jgi:uncharacterized membrane protein
LGVFTDADDMSVLTRFDGDMEKLSYLDYLSSALPYHLLQKPGVLVLGAGGGSDVLQAMYHRAANIDAVELNPQVVDLVNRGVNRCASVVSAILATLLAIHLGFVFVVLMAVLAYLLTAVVLRGASGTVD